MLTAPVLLVACFRRTLTRTSLRPRHLCVGRDRVAGRDRAASERPGQGPVLRHEQAHHRLRRLHGALQEVVADCGAAPTGRCRLHFPDDVHVDLRASLHCVDT